MLDHFLLSHVECRRSCLHPFWQSETKNRALCRGDLQYGGERIAIPDHPAPHELVLEHGARRAGRHPSRRQRSQTSFVRGARYRISCATSGRSVAWPASQAFRCYRVTTVTVAFSSMLPERCAYLPKSCPSDVSTIVIGVPRPVFVMTNR